MTTEAVTDRSSKRASPVIVPVDIGLAVAIGVLQVGVTFMAAHHQTAHHAWDAGAVVLLAAGPAALVVRRRYPVAVLVVTFSTALAYSVVGFGRGPGFLALIVAFFTAAAMGHRRAAITSLVAGYAAFSVLAPLLGNGNWPTLGGAVGLAAWLLVLFAAGEAIRIRRVRNYERAQVREAQARRQVSEERLRIARELHDVLAHNISLINVQAATALHRAKRSEQQAYDALAVIKKVSQDTLTELRSLLGALREVDEAAPRSPAPSLDRIDDLLASAAAAGVAAQVEVRGVAGPLPVGVDLAAYRIMQEALTNVVRHAGTGQADVLVVYGPDEVVVQIDDNGGSSSPAHAGTGITGMTERAAALGGQLEAGPRPGGGFRVRARLPLGSAE